MSRQQPPPQPWSCQAFREIAGLTHWRLKGQQASHMWPGMYGHITLALSSSLFTLIFGGDRAALNASMVTVRLHLPLAELYAPDPTFQTLLG